MGRKGHYTQGILMGCTRACQSPDSNCIGHRQPHRHAQIPGFRLRPHLSQYRQFPKPAMVNATLARSAPDIVAVAGWEPDSLKSQMLPAAIEAQGMKASILAHSEEWLSPAQRKTARPTQRIGGPFFPRPLLPSCIRVGTLFLAEGQANNLADIRPECRVR